MLADARVGTSGFAYREWMGSVYPRGVSAAQLLPLYAERLAAVEIASSFTRLPSTEQIAAWATSVPDGFQFALKAPGRVSQELAAGRAAAKAFGGFLDAVSELGDRLGPILVQVPDRLKCDRRALQEFLEAIPEGVKLAFEFRHPSWHDDATLRVLSAHDAALVLTDHGDAFPRLEVTASFTYVRIRREDDAMTDWAERLALLTRRGVDVYAFLKHDRKGVSVDRAMRLSALIRAESGVGEQALLT
jgi:uncharacterized protein YecE (DUF72 family)